MNMHADGSQAFMKITITSLIKNWVKEVRDDFGFTTYAYVTVLSNMCDATIL